MVLMWKRKDKNMPEKKPTTINIFFLIYNVLRSIVLVYKMNVVVFSQATNSQILLFAG